MPFNMPSLPGMGGQTPPIMPQPQQQQVIDPRAQYEQQSILADQLMQMASQYSGGGWGEALGDIIAAYRSNKMGKKAEGSLSAALDAEARKAQEAAQAEAQAAERARQRDMEDAIKLARKEAEIAQEFQTDPSDVRAVRSMGYKPGTPEFRDALMQYKGSGGTSVNVNTGEQGPRIGTIPPGYEAITDPQTGATSFRQIPGGPVEAEQRAADEKAGKREAKTEVTQGVMLDEINRSLAVIEDNPNLAAGPLSVVGQFINWGPANRLDTALEGLKPNIAFERLDQMRQSSPTGGAVGQLTDKEREALSAVFGSLRQSSHPEDLQYNLKRLNNILVDAQHGTPEQRRQLVESGQVSPDVASQIDALYMPLERESQGQPSDEELINKYLR